MCWTVQKNYACVWGTEENKVLELPDSQIFAQILLKEL